NLKSNSLYLSQAWYNVSSPSCLKLRISSSCLAVLDGGQYLWIKAFLRRSQESTVPMDKSAPHAREHRQFVPGKGVFPQFSHELALNFEVHIACNFWFNHTRCLVPLSQCQLGSAPDIVVEGVILNVQNEGSIHKFCFGYAVTDVEGNVILLQHGKLRHNGNVIAPSVETRMRYFIAKNSLIRAHINSYGHLFNPPNFDFVRNSAILKQSSWNFGFLGIVEIFLWYLDLGCSKHMTGHRDKLINFVSKFIGLGYNLFSVGQFCDSDLEVAFRKHTCFVRNLEGVDLLSGSRGSNLYTISMADMMKSSPICLLSKASKKKSWLWHCRLSHLNFSIINQLDKQGLVKGLPKLKYTKDHLCSACQNGKKQEGIPSTQA
ncbi:retrovirus-related pol polyprotein from transposon TNT 1-94, partial [Tanacetum coccineum]